MTSTDSAAKLAKFGYLTVLEHPDHGFFGGYLLVCGASRPLEFHCTAPVRVSRAQQILYGATLGDYLLGEQIGGALLRKAKLAPRVLIVDRPDLACIAWQTDIPIALLLSVEIDRPIGQFAHVEAAGYAFEIRGLRADLDSIEESLGALGESIDLAEPFDRIRLAIGEAQRHIAQSTGLEGPLDAVAA
jgi:hypothetical protein